MSEPSSPAQQFYPRNLCELIRVLGEECAGHEKSLEQVYGRWYVLGTMLGVDEKVLDDINRDETAKPPLCEMFSVWLKGRPTWEALVKALRDPNLAAIEGIKELANRIERRTQG